MDAHRNTNIFEKSAVDRLLETVIMLSDISLNVEFIAKSTVSNTLNGNKNREQSKILITDLKNAATTINSSAVKIKGSLSLMMENIAEKTCSKDDQESVVIMIDVGTFLSKIIEKMTEVDLITSHIIKMNQ